MAKKAARKPRGAAAIKTVAEAANGETATATNTAGKLPPGRKRCPHCQAVIAARSATCPECKQEIKPKTATKPARQPRTTKATTPASNGSGNAFAACAMFVKASGGLDNAIANLEALRGK